MFELLNQLSQYRRTPRRARDHRKRIRLSIECLEGRAVPAASVYAVAPGAGSSSIVRVFNSAGNQVATINAYDPSFTGGVHVSVGDVNGDGTPDIITGAGAGGGPHVRAFDGTTFKLLTEFYAYDPSFRGGVEVATGNVDADPEDEVITGAGPGGGPHIRIFDFAGGHLSSARSFFAYDAAFAGGVHVAAGNFDGIPGDEVITGAGPGGGPHVRVFAGDGSPKTGFFAYDHSFRGGVNVAAGDFNEDGLAEIVTGAGMGGGPHVKTFDGRTGALSTSYYAYDTNFQGGVRVAVADANGDGRSDVITGAGPSGGPHVRAFDGRTAAPVRSSFAFDSSFRGGVFTAGRIAQRQVRIAGHFENPQPSTAVFVNNPNSIVWGQPADGPNGGRSGLYFFPKTHNADDVSGAIIPLGTLTYLNRATKIGTEISTVDLVLTIQVGDNPSHSATVNLPLTITSTENIDDPVASADTVTLPDSAMARTITLADGTRKSIEFFGFAENLQAIYSQVGAVDEFTVREGDFQSVRLFGRITNPDRGEDFEIRQLSAGSGSLPSPGGLSIGYDFAEFEIRDQAHTKTARYTYRGFGLGAGTPVSYTPFVGAWKPFHTTGALDISQFGGFATVASVGGANVSPTVLTMFGTPAGVAPVSVSVGTGFTFGYGLSETNGVLYLSSNP